MIFIEGLTNNILITAGSCVIPLLIGILAYCLPAVFKKEILSRIVRLFGVFFESLCPLAVLLFLFFLLGKYSAVNMMVYTIIGFTICFIGYMPVRYDSRNSLVKNLVVNSLGLISTVFKWSFVSGTIGVLDLLRSAQMQVARTFDSTPYIYVFIISVAIIFFIELLRYIANELLK